MCLSCPWHGHRVDVRTGEGLYDGEGGLRSKGVVQRVHEVEVREDGGVWVRLRFGEEGEKGVRSDEYAYGPKFEGIRTNYFELPELDW